MTPLLEPLRIILISEDIECHKQLEATLASVDLQVCWQMVANESELSRALSRQAWDLILLDMDLSAPNKQAFLQQSLQCLPETPFMLVANQLASAGEWTDLLQNGATSLVLKQNLGKIGVLCQKMAQAAYTHISQNRFALNPEHILRALLQEATDSIVVKNRTGHYLLINPAGCNFLGRSVDEVLNKTDAELFTPETAKKIMDSDSQIMDCGETQIIEDLLAPLEGKTRVFQAMKCVYRNADNEVDGIINVIRDITQRKKAEEALQESEKRFRMMADAAPVFIWMTDEDGKLTYFNHQWLNFTGQNLEQATSQYGFNPIHPDDQQIFMEEGGASFLRREPFRIEFRLKNAADQQYYWMLSHGVPRWNEDGSFAGYIGCCITIHENKMVQRELSEYAAKLHNSNQELEQFATVASHDLQAPLRKIMIFSDAILKSQETLSAENHDFLQRIARSAEKMQKLITALLNLSRVTRRGKPFARVILGDVVRDVISDLSMDIHEHQCQIHLSNLDVHLDADALQLHQLLQNLIGNALKFHRPNVSPIITIAAECTEHDCLIHVSDNGIGFEDKYKERIFGTFERLHSTHLYEGTGIGLAICRKITERHGGSISTASTPGEGSTFTVRLPLLQESINKEIPETPASIPFSIP